LLALGLLQCTRPAIELNIPCGPIHGVEQVLSTPGVFIGDMHGSVESPAFLSALACNAVKSGRPLVVAMEYEAKDQSVLDQFLLTADETKAVSLLTATPHWTENQDGRASAAMRDALLEMRRLARAGAQVKLIAYDFWGAERDKTSADLIRRKRSDGNSAAYWIVFGGTVHARKTKGLPFSNAPSGSEDHEPLGYLIRDWGLIHLDAAYRGGAGWGCTGPSIDNCTTIDLGPGCAVDCPAHPTIRLRNTDPAYDGVYDVGKLTVSGPLRWQDKSRNPNGQLPGTTTPRIRRLQMVARPTR
jgi:hypothetical protein